MTQKPPLHGRISNVEKLPALLFAILIVTVYRMARTSGICVKLKQFPLKI